MRPGKGPWARLVASAIVPDERAPRAQRGLELARGGMLHSLAVGPGVVAARVSGSEEVDYEVELHTRPLPPRVWAAATKAPAVEQGRLRARAIRCPGARARGRLGRAARSRRAGRSDARCTCPDVDFSGTCKHLVALAYLFAEAIDGDPSLLLRWRGCLAAAEPAPQRPPLRAAAPLTDRDRRGARSLGRRAGPGDRPGALAPGRRGSQAPRAERTSPRRRRADRAARAGLRRACAHRGRSLEPRPARSRSDEHDGDGRSANSVAAGSTSRG